MNQNEDLNSFLISTAEIGKDFNFVQGAGGNTSYKNGNQLLIKASGFKLKNANVQNIFVEVNLKKLRNNINNNNPEPIKGTWDETKGLKPSIETYMHAILPHRFVFHVHCLNTISWVVQSEFEKEVANKFKNLKYTVIKYKKPGILLANEIQNKLSSFTPNIIFLSNHGLVVGFDSIKEVLDKLYFVSNHLKRKNKINQDLNIQLLLEISFNTKFRPSKYSQINQIASNERNIKLVTSGSLFPDQVVFLGLDPFEVIRLDISNKIKNYSNSKKLPIIIIPKAGILVPRNIRDESEELLLALSLIILKIPDYKELNYLNKEEENELINSQDEKYRLKLKGNK